MKLSVFRTKQPSAGEVKSPSALILCLRILSDKNVDVVFPFAVALKCEVEIGVANGLIGLESVLDFCLEC